MQFNTARHQLYNARYYSNTVKETVRYVGHRTDLKLGVRRQTSVYMYIFRDNGLLAHLPPVMAPSVNTVFYSHMYLGNKDSQAQTHVHPHTYV